MKKITLFVLFCMIASMTYAAKVSTGIYLVFAPYADPPTTYDVTNLDPDLEFNEDLGEGYYGLTVPLTKLGYQGVPTEKINRLCRAYKSSEKKWSQCDSYWLEGVRVHWMPAYRHDSTLRFVVKAETLEFNYNATLGFNGVLVEYGSAFKDPWYNQNFAEANPYVSAMNSEESVYTTRFGANSGEKLGNGNTLGIGLGSMHQNDDLAHYFGPYKAAETGREGGDKHLFNDGFGIPKNTNDLVIRAAFNLNRLRFCIFNEKNEYTLAGTTTDKFFNQGDKYVLFKEFAAGKHSVSVATTSFALEAGTPTEFTTTAAGLVKIWFYADMNPNVAGNLKIEQNVKPLAERYPNVALHPKHGASYLIQSAAGATFLNYTATGVALAPIANATVGDAAENATYRVRFLTKHYSPGRGIDMHGDKAVSVFSADRWDNASGVSKVWGYTDETSAIAEQDINYWGATYENVVNKVFIIERAKIVGDVEYFTIKTEKGAALTANGNAASFAAPTGAENQLWIVTKSADFTGVIAGVNSSIANEAIAYGAQGEIILNAVGAGDLISVYSTMGAQVASQIAESSFISIPAQKGMYIVKINNRAVKVLVK